MNNILSGLKKTFAGAAAAALITGAGLCIDGLLLKFTGLSVENSAGILIFVIAVGGLIFGFFCGAALGKRGLFTGFFAGLLYAAAVLCCFLWLLGSCQVSMLRMLVFLIPAVTGAAGGIAGSRTENSAGNA